MNMWILKHIYRTKVCILYGSLFKERIMKCGGLAKIGKTEYYKMLKNAGMQHTKVLPLLLCKRAVTTRRMGVCSQSAGVAESPGIWSIVLHGKWCQTTFVPRISKSLVSLNKSWQWLFCSNQNSRFFETWQRWKWLYQNQHRGPRIWQKAIDQGSGVLSPWHPLLLCCVAYKCSTAIQPH